MNLQIVKYTFIKNHKVNIKGIFMQIFFLAIFLVQFNLVVFANNDDGLNVIKSKKGFVFIFNDTTESFILEIEGKRFVDVEPEELIFSIDGQIIQFTIVPIYVFYSESKGSDTLKQHFDFELDYLSKNFEVDIKKIKPSIKFAKNGRKVFFWELDRDSENLDTSKETVVKQVFVSTNTNKFVIMLSSPLTRKNEIKRCRKKLVDACLKLEFKGSKFDIDKIRETLRSK